MAKASSDQIRSVALMSHGGTGKTSLVEALAFSAGAISRLGRVEDGNTTTDFDPDERQRAMSLSTSVVSLEHDGCRIYLVDTPGYADFVGEMIAGASAADTALIPVDAGAGVQVGTETAWRLAEGRGMPRVIVVNRLDRENADWEKTLAALQTTLGPQCQPLQLPIGQEASFEGVVDVLSGRAYLGTGEQASDAPPEMADAIAQAREALIERIAEADDDLTLKYLEGEELSEEEIVGGLKQAIVAGTLVPVVATSATKQIGALPLLRLIREELPAPNEVPGVTATVGGEETVLSADPDAPFAALIFKTTADEFVGRLTYLRVVSGTIKADAHLDNAQKGEGERVSNLSRIVGKELQHVPELVAGEIGAMTKLSVSTTFDTLCETGKNIIVPAPALPHAVYSAAMTPRSKADVDKLGPSLQRLLEEDPTLKMERDADTGDTILSGLGEPHVELAAEKLRRKFHVEVDLADRRIPYRETVTTTGKAEYLHKKQTGGHGQYARVALRVEPRTRGEGFEFEAKVVGGSVPRNFISAVEKGVTEALPRGALAQYPLTDLRVVLYDGKHHDVDSSEMAFKLAATMALREATQSARPILLEPIQTVRISAPEAATGDIISDLNSRRARVLGMEPPEESDGMTVVVAEAPMAELLHYATELRSLTGGRGTFTTEFARYDPVPEHVAQKVVQQSAEGTAAAGS